MSSVTSTVMTGNLTSGSSSVPMPASLTSTHHTTLGVDHAAEAVGQSFTLPFFVNMLGLDPRLAGPSRNETSRRYKSETNFKN